MGPNRWDQAQVVVQSLSSGRRTVLMQGGSDARYVPTGQRFLMLAPSPGTDTSVARSHFVVVENWFEELKRRVPSKSHAGEAAFRDGRAASRTLRVGVARGRSFASAARMDNSGLLLIWDARAWYAGGAPPTPAVEKASRKQASGIARVDPQTGKVEFLEGARVPQGMAPIVPAELRHVKLGERVYSFVDRPGGDEKNPLQKRRTLQAADEAGNVIWHHEIAAPVYLRPRP